MSRYRVELYINNKLFATLYKDAWSRKEAYLDCHNTYEYKEATKRAKRLGVTVMWDATKIKEGERSEL